MSTPAVSGGTLYIRGYQHLFAIAAPAKKSDRPLP